MSRSEIITAKDVLDITGGGEDIFRREIGNISYTQNVRSPFRKDDVPSFRLKRNSKGEVTGQDYGGNQWYGNAISLIMELYGLSFNQAIQRIWKDFNGEQNKLTRRTIETKEIKKEPLLFEFNDCRFTDDHKRYFDQYGLDEEFLNENNVFAISKYAINKKAITIPSNQYCFAYWAKDINKVKILTLGENVKKKWLNNCPNNYLWFYNDIKDTNPKQIWLVKSVKDSLLLKKYFGFNCVALQNESAKIFLQSKNYEKIESLTKDVVLALGTDPQGKEQSILISKERNYKWFNVDNQLYDFYDIEDVSDYVASFSIKSLENKLKIKGYL